MGHYVHIHICFACDRNEGVAAIAKKHLPKLGECIEAKWFLDDLAKRTGNNPGPKGGLSMWGIVGNHTNEEEFIEVLRPFWDDLLSGVDGGPLGFEHVLVFVEHEQTERATAFDIYCDYSDDIKTLTVKKHECPFSWAQM